MDFIASITKLGEIKNGKAYDNWTEWSENLRSVLTLRDMWVPIDKPLARQTPEEIAKCEKAFDIINLSVSNNVKSLIRGLNNSIAAWHALKDYYIKPSVIKKVTLARKIVNEKLYQAGDLEGHIVRMKSHFQSLEDLGEKWSDSMNIAFLLQSLSEEFDPVVSSFGALEEKNITMEKVVSGLSKAMQSFSFNPAVACVLCRNAGHGPSTCGLR